MIIKRRIISTLTSVVILSMLSGCMEMPADPRRDTDLNEAINEIEDFEEVVTEELESYEEETMPKEETDEHGPFADKHLKLTVTDPGYDVYSPPSWLSHDYRYGPSIMNHGNGIIDAWFASPGNSKNEYDYIAYKRSEDGGETWSVDRMVLSPTPNSLDKLSVCDPDVFYYDGYYYIGYTSTLSEYFKGFANSVYIARSENPDGPFEKWNGNGWGGSPYPLIYFDGPAIGWGMGEPSFVVKDDTVYIYTTMDSYTLDYTHIKTTEVRCAKLNDELWPQRVDFAGFAVNRTDTEEGSEYIYSDCDSWDVVYVEEYEKYLALCTNRRFKSDSCLLYFESDDGVHFTRLSEINENVICGCHNSGIMGDEEGHIKAGDPVMVGYAYAGSGNADWGAWLTRFAPAEIEITDEIDRSGEEKENLKQPISYGRAPEPAQPLLIEANPLVSKAVSEEGVYNTEFFWMDSNHKKHYLNLSDVKISGYDEDVLNIEEGAYKAKKPGETTARIEYEGLSREICFCSLKEAVSGKGTVEEIFSPVEEYNIGLSQPYSSAVRPIVRYASREIKEVCEEELKNFGIEIRSNDENICIVREDAVIVPISEGSAYIEVSLGEKSYTVKVNVTG